MGEPRFEWDEIPLAYRDGHRGAAGRLGRARAPRAVNVGNPHVVFFVDDATRRARPARPADRARPAFPERVNVNVATVDGRRHPPAGVGARRRADPRLRHRRLRHRGRGDALGGLRSPGQGDDARRTADDRLGRGGPIRDERPGDRVFEGELDLEARHERRGVTLGCRLNFAESETIARAAPAGEDVVIVNSCAVTAEAVRQTRQAIRRARASGPSAGSSSPAAPPSSSRSASRRCPRSTVSIAKSTRSFGAADGMPTRRRPPGSRCRRCAASSRSRPAATIAAPSAHPAGARAEPLAAGRGDPRSPSAASSTAARRRSC